MCLAIPTRVIELVDEETAVVDLGGVCKEISIALVDDVAVGDYVIVHVGYALNRIDAEQARKTLELIAAMGDAAPDGAPEEPS